MRVTARQLVDQLAEPFRVTAEQPGVDEVRDETPTMRAGRKQSDGTTEQVPRGVMILPLERRLAGGTKPLGRPQREILRARVGRVELSEVASGLLEVVADDLVQLQQLAVCGEPIGEALVQLGANGLGQRLVGGIPDQQMPETVGVVPGDLGAIGPHELLAHEREQAARHVLAERLGREGRDRAAMEHLALHGSTLDHAPLALVERVEARLQHRLDRRRQVDAAPGLARQRCKLLEEERVALCRAEDAVADDRRRARDR